MNPTMIDRKTIDETAMLRPLILRCRSLQAMIVKELLQLFRDYVLLFFVVYAFTADVYWAGSGVTLSLNQAALSIHDEDRSTASRQLIDGFHPPYFKNIGEVGDLRDGTQLLDAGQATLFFNIPPEFQKSLAAPRQTEVQMQVDATNSVLGLLASTYATQIVTSYGLNESLTRNGISPNRIQTLPGIVDDRRVWFNPNQTDSWFMSITELLNIVTVLAILLPAAAMVREKEKGTIEQLIVSPLSPLEIMFPKVIAMTAVIVAGTAVCLFAVIRPLFHVPFRGSLLLFFFVTTIYSWTSAGIGLFVASISRNLAQASMLVILMLAPILFLSGVWTPPEILPAWLRLGMYVSPMHYYIDLSLGILLKGADWQILWKQIVALSSLGIVVFAAGLWSFRRNFQ